MSEGALDVAGVQRDSRGVDRFGRRLRSGGPPSGLPFADLQVEPRPLDQLPFAWIALDDAAEAIGGGLEIVALQRADPRLVDGEGLVERRPRGGGAGAGASLGAGSLGVSARARAVTAAPAGALSRRWDLRRLIVGPWPRCRGFRCLGAFGKLAPWAPFAWRAWISWRPVGLATGSLPRDAVSACSAGRPPLAQDSNKRPRTGQATLLTGRRVAVN